MSIEESRLQSLLVEVQVAAPVEKVWSALTNDISEWWPADFYAGGKAGRRTFIIEAEPGGRMMEKWDDGGGVLWGTVITVEPMVRLQILGAIFPNWGGPTQCYGSWELEAQETGTLLRYGEHSMGRVSEVGGEEKSAGWTFLSNALKAHVEGTAAPKWGE